MNFNDIVNNNVELLNKAYDAYKNNNYSIALKYVSQIDILYYTPLVDQIKIFCLFKLDNFEGIVEHYFKRKKEIEANWYKNYNIRKVIGVAFKEFDWRKKGKEIFKEITLNENVDNDNIKDTKENININNNELKDNKNINEANIKENTTEKTDPIKTENKQNTQIQQDPNAQPKKRKFRIVLGGNKLKIINNENAI